MKACRGALLALLALTAACKGVDGATGPAGPQGATGAQGPQGPAGPAGPQGPAGQTTQSTWYNGTVAPPAGTGGPGDYYLNTANGDVYQKNTVGVWVKVGNLMGPTGPQGPTGPTGSGGTSTTGATRVTLTGTLALISSSSGTSASALRSLPGLSFTSPPAVTCYIQAPGSTVWLAIGDLGAVTQTSIYACTPVLSNGALAVLITAPSFDVGYNYAIAVVY